MGRLGAAGGLLLQKERQERGFGKGGKKKKEVLEGGGRKTCMEISSNSHAPLIPNTPQASKTSTQ